MLYFKLKNAAPGKDIKSIGKAGFKTKEQEVPNLKLIVVAAGKSVGKFQEKEIVSLRILGFDVDSLSPVSLDLSASHLKKTNPFLAELTAHLEEFSNLEEPAVAVFSPTLTTDKKYYTTKILKAVKVSKEEILSAFFEALPNIEDKIKWLEPLPKPEVPEEPAAEEVEVDV